MNIARCARWRRLISALAAFVVLVALLGPIVGQPAVAAGQSDDAANDELTELWSFDTGGAITSDPFVVDDVLYVQSDDGTVHAVDPATGEGLWQTPSTTGPVGFYELGVGDGLLLTLDHDEEEGTGSLTAVEIASEGEEERWTAEFSADDGIPTGRPTVADEGVVLVNLLRFSRDDEDLSDEDKESLSTLVALDLRDGAELWRRAPAGGRYAEGVVFVPFWEGGGYTALDPVDGEEQWTVELDFAFSGLLVRDGVFYGIGDGDVIALDAETGDELWRAPLTDADLGRRAHDDGALYFAHRQEGEDSDERVILAFDLDRQEVRWTSDPIRGRLESFVADGEFVYAVSNVVSDDSPGGLFVLDAASGELVAQADVPGFGVAVADGVVYTGWGDGVLHAFRLDAPVAQGGDEPAAQQEDAAEPLDLAATTLTPDDLDDVGLAGYGVGFGEMTFPDALIANVAANRDLPEEEVREILEDAGFVRAYYSYLYLPADEDDPAGTASRAVFSYVLEFSDEDGAAEAWEFLEDESDSETAEDVEDFPRLGQLGDESEATRDFGQDSATDDPYEALDSSFRLGSLHAGVTIIDWQGEEPPLADGEKLARRLLERVEASLDDGDPGLGSRVIRLTGDEIVPSADYYVVRDGEALPLYGEAADDAEARADAAADIDQTDGYRLWQQIAAGDDGDGWYLVEMQRFADEDAAADWLAGVEDRIDANDGFDDFEIDEDAPTFGDESIAFTLASGDFAYRSVVLRVGAVVAAIDVLGPETPAADAVEALAEAQAACLEDGGCLDPVPLPGELGVAEEDTDADEDDRDQDDRDDEDEDDSDSSATGGESYVSPIWDYTVNWDPETWVATGAERDDGIEFHIMGSVIVMAVIQGVEDFDGDPDTCLTEMFEASQGGDTPLVESEDLPAPETADDAVGGVYELDDFAVLYFECRPLVEGEAVLQVRFGAPINAYEAALPALEELLAGIEVA